MTYCSQPRMGHKKTLLSIIAVLSLSTLFACSTTTTSEQVQPSEEVASTPAQAEASAESNVIATGTFEGRSDHETSGKVSIVESDGKYSILLAEDFSLDGAPDPKVGLGKDGYDPSTKAGPLAALTGASAYDVPEGINIADYNEVYIWCEKFDVPLGVAKLES